MKAVKKLIKVESNKSITIKSLPFKPGSKVEVIVLPSKEKGDIFDFMDKAVKKRSIKPMSLKEIEKVVHEVRGVK
jgi:Mg/Co/Ni transporter MgtE